MSTFYYKFEFIYDDTSSADASVFIQMRDNPPIYQEHITKEDYDILPEEQKNDFLTHLFAFAGVVEVSTKAYRIWLMKATTFSWEEVLLPILYYLTAYFGYDDFESLPGSGWINGMGFKLDAMTNRRKI
jgi:hypothetical protein